MAKSAADAANPGLGYDNADALAIYGWYTMLVYVASIPGGILADKFIGQKNSVLLGGLILIAGHSILAVEAIWAFYTGLVLIIIGVGCLKPNISTMVGGLYQQGDIRRDQGFTIFYIGINVGAFVASVIVGFVGETYGWHYGFGLAGIGMAIGMVMFWMGRKYLEGVGNPPEKSSSSNELGDASVGELFGNLLKSPVQLALTAIVGVVSIGLAFMLADENQQIPYAILALFLTIVFGLLTMIYKDIDKIEKDKYVVLLISFLLVIVFWGAFEQAGGLMSLYTEAKIDKNVSLWVLHLLGYGGGAFLLFKGISGLRKEQKDVAYLFLALGLLVLVVYGLLHTFVLTSDPYYIPTAVFQAVNASFIIIFGTAVGSSGYG